MLSTTYLIILATVLVNGGSAAWMLERLQLQSGAQGWWVALLSRPAACSHMRVARHLANATLCRTTADTPLSN